jgi:hypothetical protein
MAIFGRKLTAAMAATATAAVLLGGCADGVEVNSRLLDSVGLSTAALSGRGAEPKIAQRAPLVMPPSTQKLPEPGSAPPPPPDVAANGAWPKDRDQERVAQAKEKAGQQAQYCRDGNWKERAMDQGLSGHQAPDGTQCGTIFSVMGGFFGNSTPEPDVMHGRTQ